jgi:DNA-binding MarR family transcriptional regulator
MTSQRELQALTTWKDIEDIDFGFMSFDEISRRSGLDRAHVRRTVRSLARKGLAVYAYGLCNEDGDFTGSGYSITKAGQELLIELEKHP